MTRETPRSSLTDYVFKFIGDAYLNIGFVEAKGAGAFLFTLIAVVFIRSRVRSGIKPSNYLKRRLVAKASNTNKSS